MQSKRYRIAALVLALLLVLSFGLVMFAGCADDQEKDGDTSAGENAAAKLVTDESLKSKLLALYDFEESDKDTSATLYGYDPFTGEANGRDGYYSSEGAAQTASIDSLEDSVEGSSSKTAFNVTSGITLNGALEGLYSDNTTKGASVSFWAYNYDMSTRVSDEDAETLAVDRYNIVTNSLASLTWGTLYGTRTQNSVALNIYPSYKNGNTVVNVGRGAYTEESYAARRVLSNATDTLMREFDGSATDPYTGWNAIAGNIQDATDEETYNVVYNIAHNYYKNWRYVTVSIQTDGVYFYTNGRLAYYYSAALIGTDWYTGTDITNQDELLFGVIDQYTRFIAALNGTEYFGYTLETLGAAFGMFGADACIYADDVILGYALSESEACDLYENVSGKTYTAEDLECTSATSEDEQAVAAAKAAWIAENGATGKISEDRQNFYENFSTLTKGAVDYANTVLYEAESQTATFGAGADSVHYYYDDDTDDGYAMTFSGYVVNSVTEEQITGNIDKLFWYNTRVVLWDSNGSHTGRGAYLGAADMRAASFGFATASLNKDYSKSWTGGYTGANSITDISRFCWVEITISWDGKTDSEVSIQYDIYYSFWLDVMNQKEYQVNDYTYNGETYDFTITQSDAIWGTQTFTASAADLGVDSLSDLNFDFYCANGEAAFYIMEVSGASSAVRS